MRHFAGRHCGPDGPERDQDGIGGVTQGGYSKSSAECLSGMKVDRIALGQKDLHYERLDQLTTDLLLGVR